MKNKRLALFFTLAAAAHAHADVPVDAAAPMPAMPEMDMFAKMGPDVTDIILKAEALEQQLRQRPQANARVLQQIKNLLADLEQGQDNEDTLNAYHYNLRRWEKLARLSTKEPFDEKRHAIFNQLLIAREEIVAKITQCYIKMAFAQRTVATLATVLEREPTQAEKDSYEKELDQITHACGEKIRSHQQELIPLEQKLLGDTRTFLEKYGTLISGGVIGVLGLSFIIYATNTAARLWKARKKN